MLDEESLRLDSSLLNQRSQMLLEPRKSPVQAHSTASLDAILEATIQVLLSVGRERFVVCGNLIGSGA